jgi:hypothetical protein
LVVNEGERQEFSQVGVIIKALIRFSILWVIGEMPHPRRDESGPYAPPVITPRDGEPS